MQESTDVRTEDNKSSGRSVLQKAALVVWALLIIAVLINRDKISAESILTFTPDNIWLAAFVIMGLFALKTLSVVFYSGLLFTVSGMMFDLPVAIAVNIAGALVMLIEGYAIGHAGGRSLVRELSEKYPRFAEFTDIKESSPFAFALLIRMLKVINYDLGSMYMGAAGVRMLPYLAGSLIAMLPEVMLFALAGNGIGNMDAVPAAAAVAIYAVMTIGSMIALRLMAKQRSDTDSHR